MSSGLFDHSGKLARALEGFEDRPQQRDMADAVASALEDQYALMVEAGTGTGKTLAYLIPAALSGKRVVLSTGTRALQEQLLHNDLPIAQRALGRPIHYAVLKGVSNYLCRRKSGRLELLPGTATDDEMAIREWMYMTETGDRAELGEIGDNNAIWPKLTVTPESRLGPKCPFFDRCYVTQARRKAEKADIIIVNHHLFFADLLLRERAGARVLPEYDAVIFDEAHLLEDVITEHFGSGISTVSIAQLARDLDRAGLATTERIQEASREFFAAVRSGLGGLGTETSRTTVPEGLFADPELQSQWFGLDAALETAERSAEAEAARGDADDPQTSEWETLAGRISGARQSLADQAEPGAVTREDWVRWSEVRGRQVFLRSSPVDVSHVLRQSVLPRAPSTILTSATLTSVGSFSYLRQRLGLTGENCQELLLDSPFDFRTQAILYCARDLPAPNDPGFIKASHDRIVELCTITGGHAFVLFTSHRALSAAANDLASRLPGPVFIQGQAPAQVLVERFRATPGATLLGTGTFWAGVDVPGSALSLVIMDKLPFASPADPLVAARSKAVEMQGGDAFRDYSTPQATLALRQGFGRLIRRRTDRGIAAVLDPRLVERGYGRHFIRSLPSDLGRTSTLEVVKRFWAAQSDLGVVAPPAQTNLEVSLP